MPNWSVDELKTRLKENPDLKINKASMKTYQDFMDPKGENNSQEEKKQKFNAKPGWLDGIYFGSQGEMERYCELKLYKLAGVIKNFLVHPRYKLAEPGETIQMTYVGDFEIEEVDGRKVCEDYKGAITKAFKKRARIFVEKYKEIQLVLINSKGERCILSRDKFDLGGFDHAKIRKGTIKERTKGTGGVPQRRTRPKDRS